MTNSIRKEIVVSARAMKAYGGVEV
jgi:hypothetical protein